MIHAAGTGNVECLKELIAAGSEINIQSKHGDTPLIFAAHRGHVECLTELITAGGEINKENKDGNTALILAACHGHDESLKELISAGGEINKHGENNQTALIHAAGQGHVECSRELIAAGCDLNCQDKDGNTALMKAVDVGNNVMVTLLTKAGCDINRENVNGETALHKGVKYCHLVAERQQAEELSPSMDPFSANVANVFTLLKAGASLKETTTGLSSVTVHLKPAKLAGPNSYVLRMLSAAGMDNEEKNMSISYIKCLQDVVRDSMRDHLKEIHPETNLYYTVPQLGLPHLLQSYLLFYTLLKNDNILQEDEKEFLVKASDGDIKSVLNLLEAGVDVNIQDENGMTALMKASEAVMHRWLKNFVELELIKTFKTCMVIPL